MKSLFIFSLVAISCYAVVADVKLEPVVDADGTRVLELRVSNTLKCDVSDDDLPVVWKRDGKNVLEFNSEADANKFEVSNNNLIIRRTIDDDVDTYTCEVTPKGGETVSKEIKTLSKPFIKINAPPVFIEGQKMKLECIAYGTPSPQISWRVNNETFEETSGRVRLSKNSLKQDNGVFEIDAAELSDRGDYVCVASNEATYILNTTVELEAYVRVKDKMAAVWPFIGICAEVIILCAIIFAYERNRTKIDLDESDTDGGADQKGAGDQGKDSEPVANNNEETGQLVSQQAPGSSTVDHSRFTIEPFMKN